MNLAILMIDSADSKRIRVGLRIRREDFFLRQKTDYRRAQIVLPLIEKILKKNKMKLSDLGGVEVNTRLGSFTGVRVGLSIARALGFALKIPVKKVLY